MSTKKDIITKEYLNKVKLLEEHNKSYYDKDSPVISDQRYDALKQETLKLEKK